MKSSMFAHRRRRDRSIPTLNVASLPDLIFTVLFFFMIVTHMRDVDLKVNYQVPQGTELQKLQKKGAIVPVYIGWRGGETRIQMGNRLVALDEVADLVSAERSRMSPEDAQRMTVSIKADRNTPMGVIADVKRELQKVYALKINYSANESSNIK